MKRDWELIRSILDKAESIENNYPMVFIKKNLSYGGKSNKLEIEDEREFTRYYQSVLCISDSDLAIVRDLGRDAGVALDRLTMAGHDFLDAARNEKIWKKAMKTVGEEGGKVTLGVLTQLLGAYVKHEFGL
ncbi:MAG: DUF2513 domain-containing protein [Waterburya sp.]